jgi:hypothetical protein
MVSEAAASFGLSGGANRPHNRDKDDGPDAISPFPGMDCRPALTPADHEDTVISRGNVGEYTACSSRNLAF